MAVSPSGYNIGSETLLAEQGKLPLKFTCPTSTSTCPPLSETKLSYIARTLPKTFPTERGKLGSRSAFPIAIFCPIHLQLAPCKLLSYTLSFIYKIFSVFLTEHLKDIGLATVSSANDLMIKQNSFIYKVFVVFYFRRSM